MHPHLHRKAKRFITQPDQPTRLLQNKYQKLPLRQFKMDLSQGENLNQIVIPKFGERKRIQGIQLAQKSRHRNALLRLPQLGNQIEQQNSIEDNKLAFKRSNPLYVVNSLFQIVKEELSEKHTLSHSKSNGCARKHTSKVSAKIEGKNEFNEFETKSIKMQRGPRLLDNQFTRLTQQSIFSRRRIFSEEKTRHKCSQKQEELITFYKPAQNNKTQNESSQITNFVFTQN